MRSFSGGLGLSPSSMPNPAFHTHLTVSARFSEAPHALLQRGFGLSPSSMPNPAFTLIRQARATQEQYACKTSEIASLRSQRLPICRLCEAPQSRSNLPSMKTRRTWRHLHPPVLIPLPAKMRAARHACAAACPYARMPGGGEEGRFHTHLGNPKHLSPSVCRTLTTGPAQGRIDPQEDGEVEW
jgi:hypothetical protein